MGRFSIFFLFLLSCTAFEVAAQDTLYMMSGRMKTKIHVMEMDSVKITYTPDRNYKVNRKGLVKTKTKERQDVFEIRYSDGTSELAYIQDTSGYIITADQARSYVDGCHDAFVFSHNRIVGPICYAITLSGFLVLPPIAVIAVPAVFSAVTAAFTPDFPVERIDESQVNKYYILGYQDTRKIKKVKSCMFFGIGAIASGFGLYYLTR